MLEVILLELNQIGLKTISSIEEDLIDIWKKSQGWRNEYYGRETKMLLFESYVTFDYLLWTKLFNSVLLPNLMSDFIQVNVICFYYSVATYLYDTFP